MKNLFKEIIYKIYKCKIRHVEKSFRKYYVKKVLIKDNKKYAEKLLKSLTFKDKIAVLYASNSGYSYIARNKSGRLYAYTEQPERLPEIWRAHNKIALPIQADLPFLTFSADPLYINLRNITIGYFEEYINSKKTKSNLTQLFKEYEAQQKTMKSFKNLSYKDGE